MTGLKDVEMILAHLNEARIVFNSSLDVASVVELLDRVASANPQFHSKFFSLVNQLVSPRFAAVMREAQIHHGSLVK